jgi:hypothetical protein
MSKVVIDCPLCGSKVKVRVAPAPQPARGGRLRTMFVWWWNEPVDIDSRETSFRSDRGTRLW